jgi:curved DNA-binding protein CbpA
MSVDDQALKKGIVRCFFRATQIKTSQFGVDDDFHLVQEAYKVLSDKERRAQYDQKILQHLMPQPIKSSVVRFQALPESSTTL